MQIKKKKTFRKLSSGLRETVQTMARKEADYRYTAFAVVVKTLWDKMNM